MTYKAFILGGALLAAACGPARAEDAAEGGAAPAAEAAKVDEALEGEISYVEALINNGYPDIAKPVIAATKKRWPESEARFFALEVRGLLSLGDFEGAEKKIAALPDRKGTKYWAARLEVANNLFGRNKKDEAMKIYDEFFTAFPKPPKDIRKFHLETSYAYGQLLFADKKYPRAAEIYENLLKEIKGEQWCNVATETAKMYLKIADEAEGKKGGAREAALKSATKIVDKLLWQLDQPVFFGQAVSMKAHIEVMRGNIERAEAIVDEYKPQLQELHDQIVAYDPEGRQGLLKLSPLPECLYLQAKILWDEAQKEYKKPNRDDNRVKDLMFGPKDKRSGKRDATRGAFFMAINVFLKYEVSPWAAPAGEMSEEIREFAEKKYKAKIKTRVTREQIEKARASQFKAAKEKFDSGDVQGAIADYYAVLAKYPEMSYSVQAVANIASGLLDLYAEEQDEAKKEEYRMDADAVEGYLAERFAGHPDKIVMTDAGNATIALAAKELERGQIARADRLYTAFFENYTRHANAAGLAAGKAGEAQKAGKWDDALKFWHIVEHSYSNTTYYAPALAQLSYCYGKAGDPAKEIEYINRYLPIEKVQIKRLQAKMQLAQMYKKDGFEILRNSETNDAPEAVAADEKKGSRQIIYALKQFRGFSEEAAKAIEDPTTPSGDKAKYKELREIALYLIADCWGRLNKPAKRLGDFRKNSAKGLEEYLQAYPEGRFSTNAYVKLGTIYTALGDLGKSKDALDRLSKQFPDSPEAKNAKPRLAKNLIEMGMKREGTEIYAEMLKTDGAYTAIQFLHAGEALIDARSWELAHQAFEAAIRIAATNYPTTVAKARLGEAKSLFKQGSYAEAREALDLFLADPKMSRMTIAADAYFMMVEVASEQGRTEKDATLRGKHFGAAVGALKKVRAYWGKKPQWEQDQIDLLSGDVLVRRMKAEEAMGLKEEALETCGRAASTFQVFIQAHGVSPEHPADKMSAGELANLERCYATMVPLFSKLGAKQADRVIKFGQEYLDLFPNGKARTDISNCMNSARVDLPAGGAAAAAAAEKPAAEE